jgi:6-phosphogluconolactonase
LRLIRAADAESAAAIAAHEVADACRRAVAERGLAVIAVSGGETPWRMLEHFRTLDLPWQLIHVAQVDERVAPRGDARRNLTRLERTLVTEGPLAGDHLHGIPVELPGDDAAREYQQRLESLAGRPLTLDLVQLGLGTDGHTASLLPGDTVLEIADRDVATSGPHQHLTRVTLTYPALNRARRRLWLVTGASKAARLAELLAGEPASTAPALRVERAAATIVADDGALLHR